MELRRLYKSNLLRKSSIIVLQYSPSAIASLPNIQNNSDDYTCKQNKQFFMLSFKVVDLKAMQHKIFNILLSSGLRYTNRNQQYRRYRTSIYTIHIYYKVILVIFRTEGAKTKKLYIAYLLLPSAPLTPVHNLTIYIFKKSRKTQKKAQKKNQKS